MLYTFALAMRLLIFFLCFTCCQVSANEPLQVVRINPSGLDVAAARQIVIQFNRAVVAIGRMQRNRDEIPVSISPAIECQWRWLDRTSLACQLDEQATLKKSTKYALTVWPGITTQDGVTLDQPYVHSFITERPAIRQVWFATWKSPGIPVLRVTFNQPVRKNSVAAHLFFQHRGKRFIADVSVDPDDTEITHARQELGDDTTARRIWLIKPEQELPLGSHIELRAEPGLESAIGPEAGKTHRTVLSFDTFPEFRFNGVSCYDNLGNKLLISGANPRPVGECNPLSRVGLSFSVPVLISQVINKIKVSPDLAGGRKDYDPWANYNDYSRLHRAHKKGRSYVVWLPERLQAAKQYELKSKPGQLLRDEFGRKLGPVQQNFWTDHRKPDFTLTHRTAVLESQVDSELPLVVTNLNQLKLRYNVLTAQGALANQYLELPVAKVEDIAFAMSMHVRNMLNGQTGVVYGRIDSEPQIKKSADERYFFSQVAPFQVHVKLGHFSSLVWVTDFASGQAVSEAKISIYKDSLAVLSDKKPLLARGNTDLNGIALFAGSQDLDPELETFGWRCSKNDCPRIFVKVEKNGEMALLPLIPQFEVNTYRASNYAVFSRQRKKYGHIHSWGTTAQGVYRAGDTMQYKIYVRNQDDRTLVAAPHSGYTLEVIDPSGKVVDVVKELVLSEFGGYHGEYQIPETAMIGWYRFRLQANFSKLDWQPMRVLVSDFTPSAFKVRNELNGDKFHPGQALEVLTTARLHSGGAYTEAQARVTINLQPRIFASDHPLATGFRFDSYTNQTEQRLLQKTHALNAQGDLHTVLTLQNQNIVYGKLRVESSVQDDRGKYIAAFASADYVSVGRLVGLKSSRWLFKEDETALINYLVVGADGQPAAGTDVNLQIAREETVSARVKGAGNTYVSQFNTQWLEVSQCRGQSVAVPLACEFIPEHPGTYRITARIKDTQGNSQQSEIKVWVAGKGRVIWSQPDDNSLQIIPEQSAYKVGDTARYLLKNPYPGANALVTLERYGIIKQWVMKLEESTPVLEFPIEKDLLPGFYLSVVVMSPRVAQPLAEGQIDLGKPAFKIGYVKVPVNDPWKQIEVNISTDAEVYKPGNTVKAVIQAKVKNSNHNQPIELAVIVLDEAVLDLINGGQTYFDPYQGFYKLDGLDLQNYSLLTRLLGRQKFEKKGANSGGDGGAALSMRSIFKYVSYWNPAITTDTQGLAEIEFQLPDNLTGWRILAIAVTPGDRMGLGTQNFKVNQATEIRPVMPNQVIEGDRFSAGLSVMNRTDEERELTVDISVAGNVDTAINEQRQITLAAYKRQTVFVNIKASKIAQQREIQLGEIRFRVKAYDQRDGDALQFQLPVFKQRALETAANYGSTTTDKITEPIKIPDNIYPDVGALSVELSASVIGNVAGAFRYLRDYPYICWEQKLTKGVMSAHFVQLHPWLPEDLQWNESKVLPEKMLQQAANYQAPNGGMVYYLPRDSYVSPYLSAYTALAFNWLRDSGYSIPVVVEQKLHAYLEQMLRKDVLPGFYNKGMAATVRAVALAALSKQGKVSLADLRRYRSHVPYMSLFGKAHFLQAALAVKGAQDIVKQTQDSVYAQAQQSGGKFSFNEELDLNYSRILATPLRANCAILSALLNTGSEPVAELPFKMVRMIMQTRGSRDHWENTQENMFCMNALIDYSRHYESVQPNMQVSVAVNNQLIGKTKFNDYKNAAVTFMQAIHPDDVGQDKQVVVNRQGEGRLYHATKLQYAPQEEYSSRINAGIDVRREYSVQRDGQWVLLEPQGKFSAATVTVKRGELVRVDLFVALPTARNFVVVEDFVPGGLEPVNRDLATTSAVDAEQGDFAMADGSWWYEYGDWHNYAVSRWSFYHREIKHDAVRFYSDYLPAGRYHLSYTVQAIAQGEFSRMPVHAEEMYDPDVFGKGKTGKLVVLDR